MTTSVFGRVYGLAETVAKATPLIIIGLGITIAARGGMTNLGGDGQYYAGALTSNATGNATSAPSRSTASCTAGYSSAANAVSFPH